MNTIRKRLRAARLTSAAFRSRLPGLFMLAVLLTAAGFTWAWAWLGGAAS